MTTRERPIIMGAESVRAILAGTKTQTRRVIKQAPHGDFWKPFAGPFAWHWETTIAPYSIEPRAGLRCPYGEPGDRLWIKEGFAVAYTDGDDRPLAEPPVIYRLGALDPVPDGYTAWRSPLFMPRWASRLTLEVVAVRVERVQDISDDDVRAEGYTRMTHGGVYIARGDRAAFREAWDGLNAKRGYPWSSNPWCWAITFRRAEGAA